MSTHQHSESQDRPQPRSIGRPLFRPRPAARLGPALASLLLLIIPVLLAVPVSAQVVSLSGRVLTDDAFDAVAPVGVGGVTVTVAQTSGAVVATATTDAGGNWSATAPRPGTTGTTYLYDVSFARPGFVLSGPVRLTITSSAFASGANATVISGPLSGRVRRPGGAGAPGVPVRLRIYNLGAVGELPIGLPPTYTTTLPSLLQGPTVTSADPLWPNGPGDFVGAVYTAIFDVPGPARTELQVNWFLTSDDGSQLYVDGRLVVNNDGLHGSGTVGGSQLLDGGSRHTLQVRYFEATGTAHIQVEWQVGSLGTGITLSRRIFAPSPITAQYFDLSNLAQTTTAADGSYTFAGLPANLGYVATPLFPGIPFAPAEQLAFAGQTAAVDFQATDSPASISELADLTVDEDSGPRDLPFTVSGGITPPEALTIVATSSNPGVVAVRNPPTGSGANRTLTITPQPNANGVADITVTVNNGARVVTESLRVTVNPVNDRPFFGPISPPITLEDTPLTYAFTVGDLETPATGLMLSIISNSNPDLVPNENITLGGGGANRTIAITPRPNANGAVAIRVQLSDGTDSEVADFAFFVIAQNDAPTAGPVSGLRLAGGSVTTPLVGGTLAGDAAHTIEAWIRPDPMPTGSPRSWPLLLGNPDIGAHHWLLGATEDPLNPVIQFGGWSTANGQVGGIRLPANRWTHVAAVYDPVRTTYTVYFNGVQVGQSSGSSPWNLQGVPLTLGRAGIPGEGNFLGNLDEVRVWNRARSAAEIRQDLGYPLSGHETGLLLYWRFDESDGTVATDSAPLGGRNAGAFAGAATYGLPASAAQPGALRFDGRDAAVVAPGLRAQLSGREITVEFWERLDAVQVSSACGLAPDDVSNRLNVHLPWSDGNVYWDFGDINAGGRLTYLNPGDLVGTWIHWAFEASQSGNFMRIYRNAVLVAEKAGMTPLTNGGTDLHLGNLGGPSLAGAIAEFRVWNVARSEADLRATLVTTLAGNESGLVAYYRLNEPGGRVAHAGSPNFPIDGQFSGSPTWDAGPILAGQTAGENAFGTVLVDEDTPKAVFLPAFDVETERAEPGSGLAYRILVPPAHGALNLAQGDWSAYPAENPVTYTPHTDYNGADSFVFQVTDDAGASSATYTVPIRVRDVNDVPTISSVADVVIEESATSDPIAFTVGDTDNALAQLRVVAESQDSSLIPSANLMLGGSGSVRTVTVLPVPGEIGTTTILLRVTDGQDESSTSFKVRVVPKPAYAILDLGTLGGRSESAGLGLNSFGWVVGRSQTPPETERGFVFKGLPSGGSALVDLGGIASAGATPLGINDANTVVGWSLNASGQREAFRWDNGAMRSLGFLNGGTVSEARAVNLAGDIAGVSSVNNGAVHAFLIHTNQFFDLGVGPGGDHSEALGMSENNQLVAGFTTIAGGAERGFVWNFRPELTLIEPLAGDRDTRATDVNESGQVAGVSVDPTGRRRALFVDLNNGVRLEPGLLPGGGYSEATAINRFGQLVGEAGSASAAPRAFLWSAHRLNDLNDLVSEEDDERWELQRASAINSDGFITGVGTLSGRGTRAFLAVPAWVIGRPIARPEGTVAFQPDIELLESRAGDTPQNAFFWSDVERRLYAIRPVTARLRWLTAFPSSTATNTDRVPTVGISIWPKNPSIHVAQSPADVEPPTIPFSYSFQQVIYTTNEAAVEPSTRRFTAPQTGFSVLHYLKSDGFSPNPQTQRPVFDVVKTILWNDPRHFIGNTPWDIGTPVTNANHFEYDGRNGYVFFDRSFHDGAGPDRAYDRDTRLGPIIAVNRPETHTPPELQPLVVVWYQTNRLGVAWGGRTVGYALRWPANAPSIVIASGLGSGPLDPELYPDARVYNQPDKAQAGFNPNEEHALLAPAGTGIALYALRNDLFGPIGLSQPYALLKWRDPISGDWRLRPYRVDLGTFTYPGVAGNEINPPLPLSVLTLCANSAGVSGPYWEDYHGKIYARAAGLEGGHTNIVVRWWYPLQPGFYYDFDRNGTNDLPAGSCLPLLDRRPGGTPGTPIDVTYDIRWPDDPPVLNLGETLANARRGLPDVQHMADVRIIYDDLNPTDANAMAALARFYDPLSERHITLPPGFVWPPAIQRQASGGREVFPDLPFHLKARLSHDPINHWLIFSGLLDEHFSAGDNPLLLANVLSPRERDRVKALAPGQAAWSDLIDQLYDLSRNPNQVDLQPRDGQPDRDLRLGLNTINGVVGPETFGSGPKALTAGLSDVPPPPARPGKALQFDSATAQVDLGAGVVPGPQFTEEAWIFPTASQANITYGILGHQPGAAGANRAPGLYLINRRVQFGFGDGTASRTDVTPPIVTLNTWQHLAAAFDGTAYRIYLNGIKVHESTNFAGRVPVSTPLRYLGERAGGQVSFAGRLDEIRCWNVARSGPEIAATMHKRLNGAEDGLIGLWRFDEGAGATTADASASQAHGTISGATWVTSDAPTGIPPRFITLAENNRPDLNLIVNLRVIRVDDGPYPGDVKLLNSDNLFDERVTLRHSSDFGGAPERLRFEWYYKPDAAGFDPSDLPRVNAVSGDVSDVRGWVLYPVQGNGVNDITLGEGGESSLLTLGDHWFVCRYRGYNVNGATNWSDWIGQPGGSSAQLVPGWAKRVVAGLNPFDARTTDFHSSPSSTYASMLVEAGTRYEGPIAFNPAADNLNNVGLISAYATVLDRARALSIDGTPPVNFDPANNAILLVASRLSDFYMLLGNEAYADSQDPTIGFSTSSGQYGTLATSIFAFENQLDSLLEEELALLRGRDDRQGTVHAAPVYNRLFWNFTLGEGEVAYRQAYNIRDQNFDGFITESDARTLYPQGHGDAWGHYLTALTTYYDLLRHPNFTWKPRTENVPVNGVAVPVDFLDERKFARAAAAKARAGRDIVDLTYRNSYVEDPAGQWQGYLDSDADRAWGVDQWARRAGQGAYFDWLVGTAIVPVTDPNPTHTGIQKIDRTTVSELAGVAAQATEVQARLDQADAGLNPIGLAKGAVPFDIDPTFLEVGSTAQIGRRAVQGLTQFDQILERAIKALKNAVFVWDEANRATQLLRETQDGIDDFTRNVRHQEVDYRNRLVEIFGYPYAGDIGAGKTYPSGYDGPDLYHYMYVNTVEISGANSPPNTNFTGFFNAPKGGLSSNDFFLGFAPATLETSILPVIYPRAAGDYGFVAPGSWGARRAPGELQLGLSDMVQAQAQLKIALQNYDGLIQDIQAAIDLLQAQYQIDTEKITILNQQRQRVVSLNQKLRQSKNLELGYRRTAELLGEIADSASEGIPKSLIFGLAGGGDVLSGVRAGILVAAVAAKQGFNVGADIAESVQQDLEQNKEVVGLQVGIDLEIADQRFEVLQRVKDLEHLVRNEAAARLEAYNQSEIFHQAVGKYLGSLAEGQRLLDELVRFRKETAADVTVQRYQDMTFRIFRNDALQKYRASFDVAARYAYLAANAYDYEINFLGTDQRAGQRFLTEIVRQRSLGQLVDDEPSVGQPGLCDLLGRLVANWEVLKPQFGVLTPQIADTRFSLREELFRIHGDSGDDDASVSWRQALTAARVPDLWQIPEFRRYCRPFAPELLGAQPGIVIRFPTTITFGLNFFGWPLAGGDSAYDPTQFSTKIARAGVWLSGDDPAAISQTPRFYLIPVGMDIQRAPGGDTLATREWRILDQVIPVPYPIGANDLNGEDWIPIHDSLGGNFAQIRRYGSFAAKHDAGVYSEDDVTNDTRLVGRSAWNTEWLLIIPGGTLLSDPNQGLDAFIRTVSDIKIYFQTYSYSGN